MMSKMVHLLSTKCLPSNQKQFLLNAGFGVVEADFIRVEWLKKKINTTYNHLIFTSQNAVSSVFSQEHNFFLRDKKCFCVGSKTKQLLEENGCKVEQSFDYSDQLAAYLVANHSDKKFTFFSGNLRSDMLPTVLTQNRIIFEEIEVYKTVLTPHKITSITDAILFFSPSAVSSFLQENNLSGEICFCIGNTTADEVRKVTNNIVVAKRPTVENTIIRCIAHFKEEDKRTL